MHWEKRVGSSAQSDRVRPESAPGLCHIKSRQQAPNPTAYVYKPSHQSLPSLLKRNLSSRGQVPVVPVGS